MRFPQPVNQGPTVVPLQHAGAPAAADNLRFAMKQSIYMTELLHTQLQLRLVAFLLGGSMLFSLVDPLVLLLQPSETMLYRVAMSTALRPFGVGALFAALAALLLPYILLQFGWLTSSRRQVIKVTCCVLGAAALLWIFLAWRCTHLDFAPAVTLVFARNGIGALLFALVLSFSLNAERVRSLLEDTR